MLARGNQLCGAVRRRGAPAHHQHQPDRPAALQAVRDLDQREWDGRRLKVEKARNPMV
jgi:hypothetical protein